MRNLTEDIKLIYFDKIIENGFFYYRNSLPFDVRRIFYVYKPSVPRGKHAHHNLKEILVPLNGKFEIEVTDGINKKSTLMNNPQIGIYIPPYLWRTIHSTNNDTLYLSLCSHEFDENDYINDFEKYKEYITNLEVNNDKI